MQTGKIYYLNLPVDKKILKEFHVGDIIFLTGTLITARDQAYKRIIEYQEKKKPLPPSLVNLKNCAIYHCGPIIQESVDPHNKKTYKMYSGGPTTSARMESYQEKISKILEIFTIIGKGGMKSVNFKDLGGLYVSFTGGCGAIFESFTKKIEDVIWAVLGMPEAILIINVEKFCPLIVSQDSYGQDLYKFSE
jgi:fumarate hydratase subunit beta